MDRLREPQQSGCGLPEVGGCHDTGVKPNAAVSAGWEREFMRTVRGREHRLGVASLTKE